MTFSGRDLSDSCWRAASVLSGGQQRQTGRGFRWSFRQRGMVIGDEDEKFRKKTSKQKDFIPFTQASLAGKSALRGEFSRNQNAMDYHRTLSRFVADKTRSRLSWWQMETVVSYFGSIPHLSVCDKMYA